MTTEDVLVKQGSQAAPDQHSAPQEPSAPEKPGMIEQLTVEPKASGPGSAEGKYGFAHERFGISQRTFYARGYENMSQTQMEVHNLRLKRLLSLRQERKDLLCQTFGKDPAEIPDDIKSLSNQLGRPVTFAEYYRYGLNDPDGLDQKISRLKELDAIKDEIKEMDYRLEVAWEHGDQGQAQVILAELEGLWPMLVDLLEPMMSVQRIDELKALARGNFPQIERDAELARRCAADAELMFILLGYTPDEYASYEFYQKTLAERLEYLSGVLRASWINQLNAQSAKDILDSKYHAYQALKPYYGRDICKVDCLDDKEAFVEFCMGKASLVKKTDVDAMGRGVELIDLTQYDSAYDAFEQLKHKSASFLVEDLIVSHPTMQALNQSSVNTVRVIVYRCGDAVEIHDCFMKIGREGSFVDNGGAGGILVAVDSETGMLCSDGCDEAGVYYRAHPDSGLDFKGYQLPYWDEARRVATDAIKEIPGLNYVGWDLACTDSGKWVIVEGNAMTQFFAQQMTARKGIRRKTYQRIEKGIKHADSAMPYIVTQGSFFPPDKFSKSVAERSNDLLGSAGSDEYVQKVLQAFADIRGKEFSLENPNTLEERLHWLRMYYTDPLVSQCSDMFLSKSYVSDVLGEAWVRPTLAHWESVDQIDLDDALTGLRLRMSWNKRLALRVDGIKKEYLEYRDAASQDVELEGVDEAVHQQQNATGLPTGALMEGCPEQLEGSAASHVLSLNEFAAQRCRTWFDDESNDFRKTLGIGYRDIKPVLLAEPRPRPNEMKVLAFCAGGRARALAIPAKMNTYGTYTWYRITADGAQLWKQGEGNLFNNAPLCCHLGRMASKLASPFPFVVVQFSVSDGYEVVDHLEFYPSPITIIRIPTGLRYSLRDNLALSTQSDIA